MLSRFETTDDAQDTKSKDEAKEGRCYEWVGLDGIHKSPDCLVCQIILTSTFLKKKTL